MMSCKKCQNLFVEALYDELDARQKAQFEAHLQECAECAAEYQKLTAALQVMDKRVQPQPEAEFWNNYWDNLAEKLEIEEKPLTPPQKKKVVWKLPNLFAHQWGYRIAAAAAIFLIGILIGKFFLSGPGFERQTPTSIAESEETPMQQTALDSRTQVYLERSKVLLLGLTNMEPGSMDANAIDFTHYQKVSRNLVQEAGYLKTALDDSRQRRLRELVIDLEVILMQIANLEAENDFSAVELVKSGVDRRGILLKINLEEIGRAEQKPQPGKKTGSSSI